MRQSFIPITTATSLILLCIFQVRSTGALHCVDDPVSGPWTTGNLYCLDNEKNPLSCDDCLGTNGGMGAMSNLLDIYSGNAWCYITDGSGPSEFPGNDTSCPLDPAPDTYPGTGRDRDSADDTVDAFCEAAGALDFDIITYGFCYGWSLATNQGSVYEENKEGIIELCDAFTLGLCSCIESGAC